MLLAWIGLLGVSCAQAAQVYMHFNGLGYSYNTDGDRLDRSVVPPTYGGSSLESFQPLQFVHQALRTRHNPLPRIFHSAQDNLATSSLSRGYITAPPAQQSHQNFDFSTDQMAHAQHTDESGNVLGRYSYYDEAGYHELSYKAGAGIGFVVMGGNLAKATATSTAAEQHSESETELDVGNRNGIQTNALASLQELHKYRGYT
ncbi:uncharacterized protein LOC128257551 [Drosophila gunungcola]|uniref:CG10200 n=1 Tax=Drosophila gunungcola TaxID=103775 RepID=A0A9P9YQY1_9MUSC|nr:uncharacterized protein LOC128257551 [Drosophila gunungcola]KAI8041009.1 hypothetical protein M5D96_005259 [Drosophila gunungcola]